MGTAVAAYEPVHRPRLLEISSVLLLCGALLLGLAHLDRQGRERVTQRAEQAARAEGGPRSATPARSATAATARAVPVTPASSSPGDGRRAETFLLLLMGGAGLSMAGAGAWLLSRRSA